MADTFSTSLRIRLPETGAYVNQWGVKLNTEALELLDRGIAGVISLAKTTDYTLTTADGLAAEARNIGYIHTANAGVTYTIPARTRVMVWRNAGNQDIIVSSGGSVSATIPAGSSAVVMCDGTDTFAVKLTNYGSDLITCTASPTADNHLVRKKYVDDQVATIIAGDPPDLTGNGGRFLRANVGETDVEFAEVYPAQSDATTNKFLRSDGSSAEWSFAAPSPVFGLNTLSGVVSNDKGLAVGRRMDAGDWSVITASPTIELYTTVRRWTLRSLDDLNVDSGLVTGTCSVVADNDGGAINVVSFTGGTEVWLPLTQAETLAHGTEGYRLRVRAKAPSGSPTLDARKEARGSGALGQTDVVGTASPTTSWATYDLAAASQAKFTTDATLGGNVLAADDHEVVVIVGDNAGSDATRINWIELAYRWPIHRRYGCNTTAGGWTFTLPASPVEGDIIELADSHRQWLTNALTVARNGQTINGAASDLVLNTLGGSCQLVYLGGGWRTVGLNFTSGTYTPTITAGGSDMMAAGTPATFSTRTASWWKVGPLVVIEFDIRFTAKGNGSGLIAMSLPSTLTPAINGAAQGAFRCANLTSLTGAVGVWTTNTDTLVFVDAGSTGATAINDTNLTDTAQLRGAVFYMTGE